jgi:tetratricopeptide (TPR) repeat protein
MAKKETFPTQLVPDPAQINPQTAADYAGRGWLYFSRQHYLEAQSDLETAISLDTNVDFFYSLGLILRAQGKNAEALAAFEKTLVMVTDSENRQRTTMLRRLTLGQINMIKSGDWNLEKEVWKRIR